MAVEVARQAQMPQKAHVLGSTPSLNVVEAAGESVLVISEGTGIAALMAAAAGGSPVFCAQGSPMLRCMAGQLFRDNHASHGCGHVHLCESALERCVVRGGLAVIAVLEAHHVVLHCCASHLRSAIPAHCRACRKPIRRQQPGETSMPTVLDAPESRVPWTIAAGLNSFMSGWQSKRVLQGKCQSSDQTAFASSLSPSVASSLLAHSSTVALSERAAALIVDVQFDG